MNLSPSQQQTLIRLLEHGAYPEGFMGGWDMGEQFHQASLRALRRRGLVTSHPTLNNLWRLSQKGYEAAKNLTTNTQ